ncbi:hypothetical protein LCGC14_1946250 [marine sediment metagenome]|uniref:Uncharacterized protein n=1 Tax=marine sediment metagenome TaxID=412755 RepID=A0A0F9FJ58_9ZZZZ
MNQSGLRVAELALSKAQEQTPGPWIDLTGELVSALQAFPGVAPAYRIVGDQVQLRGLVETTGPSLTFPFTIFLGFPGDVDLDAPQGIVVPAMFFLGTTAFPGTISITDKVSVSGTGGTGVATTWDIASLDGISWSTTTPS